MEHLCRWSDRVRLVPESAHVAAMIVERDIPGAIPVVRRHAPIWVHVERSGGWGVWGWGAAPSPPPPPARGGPPPPPPSPARGWCPAGLSSRAPGPRGGVRGGCGGEGGRPPPQTPQHP